MRADDNESDELVTPPESADSARSAQLASRQSGVRRGRRVSNWTAAALVVGAGAAVLGLAHTALPPTVTSPGTSATSTGHAGAAQQNSGPQLGNPVARTSGSGVATTSETGHSATRDAGAPQVSQPVATTSGSGVTTITRTIDGKPVTTTVRESDDD